MRIIKSPGNKRYCRTVLIICVGCVLFLSFVILNSSNLDSLNPTMNSEPDNLKNDIQLIKQKLKKLKLRELDFDYDLRQIKVKYDQLFFYKQNNNNNKVENNNKNHQNEDDQHHQQSTTPSAQLIKKTIEPKTTSNKLNLNNQAHSFSDQCSWFDQLDQNNTDVKISNLYDVMNFLNLPKSLLKPTMKLNVYEYNSSEWSEQNKLQVIITPHSHNDPGWLLTFEQYFEEATNGILNTIVESLSEKETRTFIWAEISYLSLWWKNANTTMRDRMRRLIVDTKQLEIVTGGWVMTDEANSYYYAMIEQMIEGHEWLRANIDESVRPRYGWSIDPFGYSATMAYLLKQMGFDAMLIQRVHYYLKEYMLHTQKFEFVWRQSWSSRASKSTDMFCHVMPYGHYDVPSTCGPEAYICCEFDFKRLNNALPCPVNPAVEITEENIESRATTLLDQYRKKSQIYGSDKQHNVVFVPLGDDFRYKNMKEAHDQYENYERLMKYMNSRADWNVNVKFGTLKDYFDLAIKNTKDSIETLSGDFFTYADSHEYYWSGYFTSRPYFKRLDRLVEYYLRTAEILFTYSNILLQRQQNQNRQNTLNDLYKDLLTARRNLGIFQHHDGITGTAKKAVMLDYEQKLLDSLNKTKKIIEYASSYLLIGDGGGGVEEEKSFFSINDINLMKKTVEIFLKNENDEKVIVLFNPSLNKRHEMISLKVNTPYVSVINDAKLSKQVDFRLSLIWPSNINLKASDVNDLPILKQHPSTYGQPIYVGFDFDQKFYELLFPAELEPLSFVKFRIKKVAAPDYDAEETLSTNSIENKFTKVTFYSRSKLDQQDFDSIGKIITMLSNKDMKQLNVPHKILVQNLKRTDKPVPVDLMNGNKAFLSAEFGSLQEIHLRNGEEILPLNITFMRYDTSRGGAYLFLPDGPPVFVDYNRLFKWIRVEDSGELRQRICFNLTILLHCVDIHPLLDRENGNQYPLINLWNVVDLRRSFNYELCMSFETRVKNGDEFFTDLNGFQYVKRKHYKKLPIQGNVYPMPSGSFIQDSHVRMSMLSAQPLGVTSDHSGILKVFLDRKLEQDDFKGLEEAINDNRQTVSRFILHFEKLNHPPPIRRQKEKSAASAVAQLNYPSIQSQIYSFDLMNPILKLKLIQGRQPSGQIKATESLMGKTEAAIPCDLRVLNMRTTQTKDERPKPDEFGLILHRLPFDDCLTPLVELPVKLKERCSAASLNKFAFKDLLSYFLPQTMRIESTYLTLTSKQPTKSFRDLNTKLSNELEPMQIEAYKVHFNN